MARCDKIDDTVFSFQTINSDDALRSKRHAVQCTIPRKRKASQKEKLSNASNCADAALVEVTGFEPAAPTSRT